MGNPYSSLKIFRHMEYLDAIENGEWKSPLYIRLKPTNICNHHCAYCTYGSGDTENKTGNRDVIDHKSIIPWDKMQEILKDIVDMGVKAVSFSGGGEPLTYQHISEAAMFLSDSSVDISLITNAELLDGKRREPFLKAKWVRVSFDSPVEEDYCALRGLTPDDYRRVITNISGFAKEKSDDCVLGINYVVGRQNHKSVFEAARLLKDLGADNVKFAALIDNEPNYHCEFKDSVIEQIHAAIDTFQDEGFRIINNYENDWMDKNLKGVSEKTCYTCRLVTVIAADQNVYLCHTRAYDSKAKIGSISDKSFKDLWFSEETRTFIEGIVPANECRTNCVYENRNRVISDYLSSKEHINFI